MIIAFLAFHNRKSEYSGEQSQTIRNRLQYLEGECKVLSERMTNEIGTRSHETHKLEYKLDEILKELRQ